MSIVGPLQYFNLNRHDITESRLEGGGVNR
jgi:hypothetical protein